MGRLLLCLGVVLAASSLVAQARRDVILATTTSTYDTGLLDSLTPRFERICGCRLKTIAVGTGQALALAARGEADVVLGHAPALEERYVAQGVFRERQLVMTNDFIVVGPRADPAGLRQLHDLPAVFQRLAEGAAPFASRGDSSGTHILELGLWKAAARAPSGPWYLQVGQGMGATLRVASEKGAYTLTDRGTFLALRGGLELDVVFAGAPQLLNIYHVMSVNPEIFPNANFDGGRRFAAFIVSPPIQDYIRSFGVAKFGEPLFTPQAGRREEDLVRGAP